MLAIGTVAVTARTARTWTTFGVCVALVGFALFWVTREVLALEKRESSAPRATPACRKRCGSRSGGWTRRSRRCSPRRRARARQRGRAVARRRAVAAPRRRLRAVPRYLHDRRGGPAASSRRSRRRRPPAPGPAAAASRPGSHAGADSGAQARDPAAAGEQAHGRGEAGRAPAAGENAPGRAPQRKDSDGRPPGSPTPSRTRQEREGRATSGRPSRPEGFLSGRRAARALTPPPPPPPAEVAKQPRMEYDEAPPPAGQTAAPRVARPRAAARRRSSSQTRAVEGRVPVAGEDGAGADQSKAVRNPQVGRRLTTPATVNLAGLGFAVTEIGTARAALGGGPDRKPELFLVAGSGTTELTGER